MKSKVFDLMGISAAVLCLIHCLLFPVLMVLPFGFEHDAYIDLAFLVIGAVVVYRVTKSVQSRLLKTVFWIAIGLIAASVMLDLAFHVHSPLIYIGAALLITAHLFNFRNHRHEAK